MYSISGTSLLGVTKNTSGLWILIQAPTSGMTLDTTASRYAPGCICVNVGDGKTYKNNGTTASPSWQDVDEIATSEIADDAVTFAKMAVGAEARTATADGTGTGAITAPTAFRTFIAVTSAAATNQIALPDIDSTTIGQELWLTVGANGYELITPASSNDTINQVDSDGTNQLDVAADTTLVCVQVSATGWVAIQVAATTITVVAPDND